MKYAILLISTILLYNVIDSSTLPKITSIQELCEIRQVSYSMIKRQIFRESSYRPHVISHKGAVGLMQVLPSTASDFCQYSITIEMLKDKLFNVTIGIRYLLHLRGFYIYLGYDSSKAMQLAMCSYYEGPGATISRHFKGKLCKATKKAYYRYYVFNKTPKPLTNLPKVKLNSYAKFIVGV